MIAPLSASRNKTIFLGQRFPRALYPMEVLIRMRSKTGDVKQVWCYYLATNLGRFEALQNPHKH